MENYSQIKYKIKKWLRQGQRNGRSERGQVLVVVALSVIAITAVVGLTVDVGLVYLNHGKLRRAVDAAALAASAQFREGYSTSDLQKAAQEFLVLNGITDPTAIVEICDPFNPDPAICTDPPRKLVRVHATSIVNLAFMRVLGIRQTTIQATAVSEAASMDVVLVIDASDSMTYDADPSNPMRDPAQCNPVDKCHPFWEVKDAAKEFVKELYMPYDRVSIVTFDNSAKVDFSFADFDATPDGSKQSAVLSAIDGLGVVDPGVCDWTANQPDTGPCRDYQRYEDNDPVYGNNNGIKDEPIIDEDGNGFGDVYYGFDCLPYHWGNPDTCGTTAIGKGLQFASNEFSNPDTFREEALWVVILLTDGAANGPSIYCPHTTWTPPFCRNLQLSRHCSDPGDTACTSKGFVYAEDSAGVSLYDTDDYAHDKLDALGEQQDVLIFTIGLGKLVKTSVPRARKSDTTVKCSESPYDPVDDCYGAGELLLQYGADVGRGKYYFAPAGNQLEAIFLDIAQYLATRLTQ